MNHELTHFIIDAGWVVKAVLMMLLIASLYSWNVIVQRWLAFKRAKKLDAAFQSQFQTSQDVSQLYRLYQLYSDVKQTLPQGMIYVFQKGLGEYFRLKDANADPDAVLAGAERQMQAAEQQELDDLSEQVSVLATIGSTAPYVGLFGTVWGIMTAFQGLGHVQQATIAMVAPGISEALIATAMGLFAAIPAVVAYNRCQTALQQAESRYSVFQQQLSAMLHRDLYSQGQGAGHAS